MADAAGVAHRRKSGGRFNAMSEIRYAIQSEIYEGNHSNSSAVPIRLARASSSKSHAAYCRPLKTWAGLSATFTGMAE